LNRTDIGYSSTVLCHFDFPLKS